MSPECRRPRKPRVAPAGSLVARWLWLAWRLVLFCALLSSPVPLARGQPGGLLRLQHALRQLRRAVPSLDSQRAETPYPFRPEDGELLRRGYQAKYGVRGQELVDRLGGEYLGPKEYLAPPPAPSRGPPA
ncbi:Chemokine-like protein TAFA-4 [Frankliniella fusca]|uniref:Chemokine-like protein TAFA-4 n=1 Tax=Frankliniella fusca TaxID=407009 RepID=A0AAE1I4M9_9NEOP|nr:Chemokine-like protein TAFA-4 [Frankliniella fusca]